MSERLDALALDAKDNVATALRALAPGERVRIGTAAGEVQLVVSEPIARCHKLALMPLAPGDLVYKYGEPIGTISAGVGAGGHVHVHNLQSRRARRE
jgi:hypothetical protein